LGHGHFDYGDFERFAAFVGEHAFEDDEYPVIQARLDEPRRSVLMRPPVSAPRFRSGGETNGKVVGFKGIDDQAREVGIAPTAVDEVVEALREAVVLRGGGRTR
jgi:hypothetical protein